MTYAAVDWGTSSFRLWLTGADGVVIAERRSAEGMVSAAQAGFENVLESHLSAVSAAPDIPVVICGMAGARNGWIEAKYLDAPVHLKDIPQYAVMVPNIMRTVLILPGVAQRVVKAVDVMRGEEVQILGAESTQSKPGPAIYCIPGTHSKWVRIVDDKIVHFTTYMTGELFDVLSNHSILAHSLNGSGEQYQETIDCFADAVNEAFTQPEQISHHLFSIRARTLLLNESSDMARNRLSGLLIGLELTGAVKNNSGTITLLGTGKLAQRYKTALEAVNINVREIDAEEAVRAGLAIAAESLNLIRAQGH